MRDGSALGRPTRLMVARVVATGLKLSRSPCRSKARRLSTLRAGPHPDLTAPPETALRRDACGGQRCSHSGCVLAPCPLLPPRFPCVGRGGGHGWFPGKACFLLAGAVLIGRARPRRGLAVLSAPLVRRVERGGWLGAGIPSRSGPVPTERNVRLIGAVHMVLTRRRAGSTGGGVRAGSVLDELVGAAVARRLPAGAAVRTSTAALSPHGAACLCPARYGDECGFGAGRAGGEGVDGTGSGLLGGGVRVVSNGPVIAAAKTSRAATARPVAWWAAISE